MILFARCDRSVIITKVYSYMSPHLRFRTVFCAIKSKYQSYKSVTSCRIFLTILNVFRWKGTSSLVRLTQELAWRTPTIMVKDLSVKPEASRAHCHCTPCPDISSIKMNPHCRDETLSTMFHLSMSMTPTPGREWRDTRRREGRCFERNTKQKIISHHHLAERRDLVQIHLKIHPNQIWPHRMILSLIHLRSGLLYQLHPRVAIPITLLLNHPPIFPTIW